MITANFSKKLTTASGIIDLKADFSIKKGEIVALYGKSGVGKTTILRIMAGLTNPENGLISVKNKIWFDKKNKINLAPKKRKIGFVFQDYALFPNMTVKENIEFAAIDKSRVRELIRLVHMDRLQDRKPHTLSGGQQQRVALARAIAGFPDLLLLDEPLSALDYEMRQQLQDEIITINRRYNITIMIVSHDLTEIFKLANQVIHLDEGKIIRTGKPAEVFAHTEISGKFQFVAEIVDIVQSDVVFIISALVGNNIIKVIASRSERENLNIGDRVLVASKAFNPIIKKIENI